MTKQFKQGVSSSYNVVIICIVTVNIIINNSVNGYVLLYNDNCYHGI